MVSLEKAPLFLLSPFLLATKAFFSFFLLRFRISEKEKQKKLAEFFPFSFPKKKYSELEVYMGKAVRSLKGRVHT